MTASVPTRRLPDLAAEMERLSERAPQGKFWPFGFAGIAIIACIVFLAFGTSVACSFLADDFLPITYLFQGFHGHPELLLERLISPWQDADIQLFYRPLSELSLICDYALHGPSAAGFHLSNLLMHVSVCVVFFLLGERLLESFGCVKTRLPALIAATLFAANPLNAESVVWVIGRVDLLCAFFYLLSFYLFGRGPKLQIASCCCFVAALGAKETAATLPFVLCAYQLIVGPRAGSPVAALKPCVPFFAALAGFIVVRAQVIGDWLGGYRGSIADAYNAIAWHYPLTNGNLWKLCYPFNEDLISLHDPLAYCLRGAWVLAGVLLLAHAWLYKNADRRVAGGVLFLFTWLIISAALGWRFAIIQPTLAGGRFAYFPLLPGTLLFLLLLGMPFIAGSQSVRPIGRWTELLSRGACALVCALMLVSFVLIDRIDGRAWLEASAQALAFKRETVSLLEKLPSNQKIVIVNVPTHYHGAHICYRFEMLSSLFKPPFTSRDLSDRIFALQLHNDGNVMNRSLLRRLVVEERGRPVLSYVWNFATKKLQPFPAAQLSPATSNQATPVVASAVSSGTLVRLSDGRWYTRYVATFDPGLNTAAIHFVTLKMTAGAPVRTNMNVPCQIRWQARCASGDKNPSEKVVVIKYDGCDNSERTYRVSLGDYKPWFVSAYVTRLALDLPAVTGQPRLVSIVAEDGGAFVPTLESGGKTVETGTDGAVIISSTGQAFHYDGRGITGSNSAVLEISKPRSAFEHFTGMLRDDRFCVATGQRRTFNGSCGDFRLSAGDFPEKTTYQIRLFATDKNGRICGLASDPIQVEIH